MLESFIFDGKRITLIAKNNSKGNLNFFSADSMTLLVGQNGSGKTRAMHKIASYFSNSKPSETEDESEDFTWENPTDQNSTYVIYYTPTSFGVQIPKTSHRFYKLESEPLAKQKRIHEKTLKDLKSTFDLKIKQKLRLNYLGPSQLSSLLSKMFCNLLFERHKIQDEWIINFLMENSTKNDQNADSIRPSGLKITEKLKSDFLILAKEKLGNDFTVKLRAYSYARAKHKKTDKSEFQLLNKLGFTLKESDTIKWKTASNASITFDSVLKVLHRAAIILNDPSLEKNDYDLSEDQLNSLSKIEKLEPTGEIYYSEFSAGAAALLDQFSKIDSQISQICKDEKRNIILLIDEGDAFLHIQWQQMYIDFLDKTIAKFRDKVESIQVIISTHSPILISDFPRHNVLILGQGHNTQSAFEISTPPSPALSFCAPINSIINNTSSNGTISAFAERKVKEIISKEGVHHEEMESLIELIDDPIIRSHLKTLFPPK